MYASRYVFWSSTPDGNPLLFEGRTGALLELTEREHGPVRETLARGSGWAADELARLGFLVQNTAEEQARQVASKRGTSRSSSRVLDVTISPTYGCNFRCTYCYVHFDDRRMTDRVQALTLSYLRRQLLSHPQVNVTWFGGEPLLQWRSVARMATEITRLGDTQGRRVHQFLTTNGYLLTAPVLDTLVDAGIRWYHVTIDGADSGQDMRRVLRSGHATYDRVFTNLLEALRRHADIGLTLRMNLEPNSVHQARPLLERIPEGYRHRVQVHPTGVIRDDLSPDPDTWRRIAEVVTLSIELGYAYYDNDIPVGRPYHCAAESSDNLQIAPDGSVHACSPSGKPEVRIGRLTPAGGIEPDVARHRWHAAHQVEQRCLNCNYLCFCQGGCRVDRLRGIDPQDCARPFSAMDVHILNRWLSARRAPSVDERT